MKQSLFYIMTILATLVWLFQTAIVQAQGKIFYVPEFDPQINPIVQRKSAPAVYPKVHLTFESQVPSDPGATDSRLFANCSSDGQQTPAAISAVVVLPQGGMETLTASTGLYVELGGIGTSDCPSNQGVFADDPANANFNELRVWMDTKDIVYVKIFYRNMGYMSPYDYGDIQVADVINGVKATLQYFEDQGKPLNRQRLYMLGGSGGAHLALQVVQAVPKAFAEVYAGSGLTLISTQDDVQNNGYTLGTDGDANGSGWIVNAWSLNSTDLTTTKSMERLMRAPQRHAGLAATFGNKVSRVYVMHGLNDGLVVPQHFWDYRDKLFGFAGVAQEDIDDYQVPGDTDSWQIANWKFTAVPGGNHYLGGGPADRNSRYRAVNSVNPDCFTSELGFEARLDDEYIFPPYEVPGDAYRQTFFFTSDDGMREMHTIQLAETERVLRVNLLGSGNGNVLVSPENPGGVYNVGDMVTLTAVPEDGATFNGWSTSETANSISFTISQDRILYANFEAPDTSSVGDWSSY